MTLHLRGLDLLVGLKIRLSNVVAWASDATLSGEIHRRLRMLSFVQTNTMYQTATRPLIRLDAHKPLEALTMCQLCDASFASFPIDEKWWNLAFLHLDFARLKLLPAAITQLPLVDLAVRGNAIPEVPRELFVQSPKLLLGCLWLDHNPLTELPPSIKGGVDGSRRSASVRPWMTLTR